MMEKEQLYERIELQFDSIMSKYIAYIIILIIMLSCCNYNEINGNYFKNETLSDGTNKVVFIVNDSVNSIIFMDKMKKIKCIKNYMRPDIFEVYYFSNNGIITTRALENINGSKNGQVLFFYENGNLSSRRKYKNDLLFDYGEDYYENSGNLKSRLYYDSTGRYYYVEKYSDTSSEKMVGFNPDNKNSYRLIKEFVPEPNKSILVKQIEKIGLDSLKQIH